MQKPNRVGETSISSCGQKMTIIRYGNTADIDIKFEDGEVVTNKTYQNFRKGTVKNPKCETNAFAIKARNAHEGETRTNRSGLKMTVLKYHSALDVDIQFEDGTIVQGRKYSEFKKGLIKNPNYHPYANRLGEESVSSCGQKMTIIKYENAMDVDVKFEDGTVVSSKTYDSFKKGMIANPNSRVGEKGVSIDNQKMTIIKYHNTANIEVEFEDGTVVKGKKYSDFKKGKIRNPNYRSPSTHIGEEKISSCGLKMRIIKYISSKNIDVQFEDRTEVCSKAYHNFLNGEIGHPELSSKGYCNYKRIEAKNAWTEGEKVYYICKCQICGEEGIWTPQEMIEHAKKH